MLNSSTWKENYLQLSLLSDIQHLQIRKHPSLTFTTWNIQNSKRNPGQRITLVSQSAPIIAIMPTLPATLFLGTEILLIPSHYEVIYKQIHFHSISNYWIPTTCQTPKTRKNSSSLGKRAVHQSHCNKLYIYNIYVHMYTYAYIHIHTHAHITETNIHI